jgi:hypothetical protein
MNTQNFNQSDGFPLETETLDEMQKAYLFLQHFGHLAGNYSIISGCEVSNGVVSDGAIFLNGELLEFKGANLGADIIIVQTVTPNEFENATEKDVLYKRHATFGFGLNSIPWANFKRFKNVVELTEQKAELTLIETLIDRIENLEARPLAQPNVQSNWNQNLNTADDFIKNKPSIPNILAKGTAVLGNVAAADQLISVNFPAIGTNEYIIVGSLISKQIDGNEADGFTAGWNRDNDVSFVIVNKTASSFQIALREYASATQNLEFDYIILQR